MNNRTSTPRTRRLRPAGALLAAGGLLTTVGLAGLGPVGAQASSHREAPLIAGTPQYDTTDVYAFRSPDRADSVTLVANWIPFEEPAGGPSFYPFATDARYNIKIDNDGDARPDITFRWTFKDHYRSGDTFLHNTGPVESLNDPDPNFFQTYTLSAIKDGRKKVLVRNAKVAPSRVGDASMPDYASLRDEAVRDIGKGRSRLRSFVGQAEDPFFLDLRVFDLLYGADLSETGNDTLAGFNVNSVALQVPSRLLVKDRDKRTNPVIGVWSTTEKKSAGGKYRQVSRLGSPLVNEVVVPVKDKNRFNASRPKNDGQFLDYVTKPELSQLLQALYGDAVPPAPAEPRSDLVSVFLTGLPGLNQPDGVTPSEQLRLNVTTPVTDSPSRLGVIDGDAQGFPNGRRLGDDVVDIALQVVQGELTGTPNDLGDGVDENDVAFGEAFPYLALPASGSDPNPHGTGAAAAGSSSSSATGAGWWSAASPQLPASALALGVLALGMGAVGLGRRQHDGARAVA